MEYKKQWNLKQNRNRILCHEETRWERYESGSCKGFKKEEWKSIFNFNNIVIVDIDKILIVLNTLFSSCLKKSFFEIKLWLSIIYRSNVVRCRSKIKLK